jgi:hypothetical protein
VCGKYAGFGQNTAVLPCAVNLRAVGEIGYAGKDYQG